MVQVARAIGLEVREVLYTATERGAAHANQDHRDLTALRASLGVRRDLLANPPDDVILLDDVLTTGCSFKVCKAILSNEWPEARIVGLFVARRVPDRSADLADFDFSHL
jgi:predicted amidophosphoribosyltransferase